LPLAFLAPDIVEAILKGRQPIELTAARLMRIRDLPLSWAEQPALPTSFPRQLTDTTSKVMDTKSGPERRLAVGAEKRSICTSPDQNLLVNYTLTL
jgi:hypothetical protein